ncbi:MAG TPA: serine/threonine-protein kinase [Gemmataceae bacterium]|nr:serine/threonine-protein kinase [Gemmataceae bacterium]
MDTGGSEIIEGYRLRGHLMTGQTSQVYEVVEVLSSRHFAMKMLLPETATSSVHRSMLFHEAEVGKQLSHQNIIRIYKVSRSATLPFFVMEYFPSGSLRTRLLNKQFDFIKENLHNILKQAATGLAFMNASGWVHRDVKPDNMLVNAAGDVRLIDFAIAYRIPTGLAKFLGGRKRAQGTRSYMSPEQIFGKRLDGRADIYSFGATCYELATGRPPFRGKDSQDLLAKHVAEKPLTPQAYEPNISDDFAALILRCLAKKREDRFNDFHEVLMALRSMRIFKNMPAKAAESGS